MTKNKATVTTRLDNNNNKYTTTKQLCGVNHIYFKKKHNLLGHDMSYITETIYKRYVLAKPTYHLHFQSSPPPSPVHTSPIC